MATKNKGKVRELRGALRGLAFRIYSLDDFIGTPGVKEDGKSFFENALKKARFYSRYYGMLTISDDSGLEVDALKGKPGIYSARYAGEEASDRDNIQKLLKAMESVPAYRRKARFRCCIAIVSPDGKEAITEGSRAGKIGFKEVGRGGFGYDPVFILPLYKKTMAQLALKEKNRLSHRGKALRKLRKIIRSFMS